MYNIILLAPLTGNGGIASWTKKYLTTFKDEQFQLIPVNVSPSENHGESFFSRTFAGLLATHRILKDLKQKSDNNVAILHTTTSGNIGSFRDIQVAKWCKKRGIKTILHCRYGCIPEDYVRKGLVGFLLRRSMRLFDQVWVLDNRTYKYLKTIDTVKDKVFLTPNSIEVKEQVDLNSKDYKQIAFIGNLIPTKGLYELTEAALQSEVRLDIIGPGPEDVVNRLKAMVGEQLNKKVFIHGRLPNPEAVKFMHQVDMIALPTYYPSEAFPISILEAMSLTKMVISCPRAAIPDMLTDIEGNTCGMLVPEKSVQGIVDAICWCQNHKEEADRMCQKAYEKVFACYRTDVVYKLYKDNYRKLLEYN